MQSVRSQHRQVDRPFGDDIEDEGGRESSLQNRLAGYADAFRLLPHRRKSIAGPLPHGLQLQHQPASLRRRGFGVFEDMQHNETCPNRSAGIQSRTESRLRRRREIGRDEKSSEGRDGISRGVLHGRCFPLLIRNSRMNAVSGRVTRERIRCVRHARFLPYPRSVRSPGERSRLLCVARQCLANHVQRDPDWNRKMAAAAVCQSCASPPQLPWDPRSPRSSCSAVQARTIQQLTMNHILKRMLGVFIG